MVSIPGGLWLLQFHALRNPAAFASASVQNHWSPRLGLIRHPIAVAAWQVILALCEHRDTMHLALDRAPDRAGLLDA
jgi:hypothetical protein